VAIDHGFFNEFSMLGGIENMPQAVAAIVAAGPDAIQLTVGQAGLLQGLRVHPKPALVLRTDVANVYGSALPEVIFSRGIESGVEQALRLDAACVVVNLFLVPGQADLHRQCIDNICKLKPVCDQYAMPLMIEPLVMQANSSRGGYMVDGNLDKIIALVRQARELGADIIKADPCDDVSQYHRVIETAGVPVLVRGGGRVSDEEILTRTAALMKQGATGIVYGRNVIQHAKPTQMTKALMAIVHQQATVAAALDILKS
jgi:DhnA family fructose-bisphosphate aldolase class Ia